MFGSMAKMKVKNPFKKKTKSSKDAGESKSAAEPRSLMSGSHAENVPKTFGGRMKDSKSPAPVARKQQPPPSKPSPSKKKVY